MPVVVTEHEPSIGILMLNTSFPRLKGDIGHPDTFSFPVRRLVVEEANSSNVVVSREDALVEVFVEAAQKLESEGSSAIATSCGFLARFQKELADGVRIPVASSSLLLLPLISQMIGSDKVVGIMSARAESLSVDDFKCCGAGDVPVDVIGMEGSSFYRVYVDNGTELDKPLLEWELAEKGASLKRCNPDLGAILLECTNMPPFAGPLRAEVGVPVFDVTNLVELLHASVSHEIWRSV